MSAQITIEDLTATRLFLTRSFQRIESLMETLGAEVMAILDEVNSQAKSASEYKMARTQKRGQFTSEFQPLVLWDWCVREGRHIAWGLRFPGDYKAGWAGHPFARTEPKVDEIFVYVGTDDFKEAPIDVSKAGRFAEKGWKFFDEDQFGMKALSMYQLLGGERATRTSRASSRKRCAKPSKSWRRAASRRRTSWANASTAIPPPTAPVVPTAPTRSTSTSTTRGSACSAAPLPTGRAAPTARPADTSMGAGRTGVSGAVR